MHAQRLTRTRTAASILVAAAALSAEGLADEFVLAPLPSPASVTQWPAGAAMPEFVSDGGGVAGTCQWTNAQGFIFTEAGGSVPLVPAAGVIFIGPRAMNASGQVLAEGCVPPPSGNGACGRYLFRTNPGAPDLRLDTLPGAPATGYFHDPFMADTGAVAVTNYRLGPTDAWHFSDATGWTNLTPLVAALTGDTASPITTRITTMTDEGHVLIWASRGLQNYVRTLDGAVASMFLPASAVINDINAALESTGSFPFNGVRKPYRSVFCGAPVNLDPQNLLPGGEGSHITDSGLVVGTFDGGFFRHSAQSGLEVLGHVGFSSGQTVIGRSLIGVSENGMLIGQEHSNFYETQVVVAFAGRPLQKLQDAIDPARTRIIVQSATAPNDSGQFGVTGTAPSGNETVTFLVTPAAPCAADFNKDDAATVQDIYDFLSAWSSQAAGGAQAALTADFNRAGGITVQDIYDFLGAWSAGCN